MILRKTFLFSAPTKGVFEIVIEEVFNGPYYRILCYSEVAVPKSPI